MTKAQLTDNDKSAELKIIKGNAYFVSIIPLDNPGHRREVAPGSRTYMLHGSYRSLSATPVADSQDCDGLTT